MMELTINNTVYAFSFGFGFLKSINPTVKIKDSNGASQDSGLRYSIAGLMDGDVFALVNILRHANVGKDPRVTDAVLESYIENCDDIEALFSEVLDFLSEANCTKRTVQEIKEAVERAKKDS